MVPARIWLIGGGDENRSVMSLQNASRRRGAMERTLQGKSHDTVSGTHEVLSGLVSEYRGAAKRARGGRSKAYERVLARHTDIRPGQPSPAMAGVTGAAAGACYSSVFVLGWPRAAWMKLRMMVPP